MNQSEGFGPFRLPSELRNLGFFSQDPAIIPFWTWP